MREFIFQYILSLLRIPLAYSITDIPDRYRTTVAKSDFVQWLREMPVHNSVKRNLIATWSRHTGGAFSRFDYADAGIGGMTKG